MWSKLLWASCCVKHAQTFAWCAVCTFLRHCLGRHFQCVCVCLGAMSALTHCAFQLTSVVQELLYQAIPILPFESSVHPYGSVYAFAISFHISTYSREPVSPQQSTIANMIVWFNLFSSTCWNFMAGQLLDFSANSENVKSQRKHRHCPKWYSPVHLFFIFYTRFH